MYVLLVLKVLRDLSASILLVCSTCLTIRGSSKCLGVKLCGEDGPRLMHDTLQTNTQQRYIHVVITYWQKEKHQQ